MKEELILRILDKASAFIGQEQIQQLRTVVEFELYDYDITSTIKSLVLVSKAPEMLMLYLASKKLDGLAAGTLSNYKRVLIHFLKFTQKEVQDITTMDIRLYLAKILKPGN